MDKPSCNGKHEDEKALPHMLYQSGDSIIRPIADSYAIHALWNNEVVEKMFGGKCSTKLKAEQHCPCVRRTVFEAPLVKNSVISFKFLLKTCNSL